LAIIVVESPTVRKIFLLLCEELKKSDIPSHPTMYNYIEEAFEEHMKQLEEEMVIMAILYKILIWNPHRNQLAKFCETVKECQ